MSNLHMFLRDWLRWLLSPPKPGTIYILLEKQMAGQLRVRVTLPPVGAPDVVSREFTRTIDGGTPIVETLAPDLPSTEFVVADGSVCDLSLVDIDDAGNRSPASSRTFTAVDTIPPAQPGNLTVEVVGEEP